MKYVNVEPQPQPGGGAGGKNSFKHIHASLYVYIDLLHNSWYVSSYCYARKSTTNDDTNTYTCSRRSLRVFLVDHIGANQCGSAASPDCARCVSHQEQGLFAIVQKQAGQRLSPRHLEPILPELGKLEWRL